MRGYCRCGRSVPARSEAVLRVQDTRVRFHEQPGSALGLEICCIGLRRYRVLHRDDHVQVGFDAHQLHAEATEPRVGGLVVDHARILRRAARTACRRRPLRHVGAWGLCVAWCPGRESNPHTFRPRILSPLRLPISSPGREGEIIVWQARRTGSSSTSCELESLRKITLEQPWLRSCPQ